MFTPRQPKTRESFPQSEGWMRVENSRPTNLTIFTEPWGSGFDLKPGEFCFVHLVPDGEETLLDVTDDGYLTFYCCDALYQNHIEIYDFQD
jgi:hypothetical protein